MKVQVVIILAFLIVGCNTGQNNKNEAKSYEQIGAIVRNNEKINDIISLEAKPEIIAQGYVWSEGPLWLPSEKKLIWSDVPQNTIFQWQENMDAEVYLQPSGYTAAVMRDGEAGSNGLLLDGEGNLILCQHGDRRVARMMSKTNQPTARYQTIADSYEGKRFNSPNDAAYGPDGHLFFTDPPYGLKMQMKDPAKEIPYQGIYRISPGGEVLLMSKTLSRPNGIAFSPDKTKCYVANSDPQQALWMVYDVSDSITLINERVFFDATHLVANHKGLPDGLKVNKEGVIFASGPGGILVFSTEAEHMATISTGEAVSNCALNEDETVLYMTSDMYIVRLKLL
jgi:gluconolactonase